MTFEDPMFNASEPKDYFINDCCYGDDVARALMEQLRSHGIQTDTDPGQEDFGWYFGFRAGGIDHQFIIGHRPADGTSPAVWIGGLERKAGLLGTMFGARDRGIKPDAASIIHLAISSLPEVSNIHWHRKKDFDAGVEQLGKSDPTV